MLATSLKSTVQPRRRVVAWDIHLGRERDSSNTIPPSIVDEISLVSVIPTMFMLVR